ncbi:MAG: thiamine pyrophosphate-dependent enzyme [Bordetella sp.]|nr:thiamine pyrophosphate-dependent enzyme [Bordetella sp.]
MNNTLHRRDVAKVLLADRGNSLVVAGLGSPIWDITAVEDSHANFPAWGGMGGAACMGLGLALAQPERAVLVVTGDGEMLMGLGALATIGVARPRNLSVVVMNNGQYGETGLQKAHTSLGVDLAGVATASGIERSFDVKDDQGVQQLANLIYTRQGPVFASVRIHDEKLPPLVSPRDGAYLKNRFRIQLLGAAEAME